MNIGQITPFGNPDGSRAGISEVQQEFISFDNDPAWSGIAMKENDLSVRIIVGRKGSGKTLYLRRLRAFASGQGSLHAAETEFDNLLPTTESVITIHERFKDAPNIAEKWTRIWYAAIMRSLVSYLLNEPELRKLVPHESITLLINKYVPDDIIREFGTPLGVYSQASEILNGKHARTPNTLNQYLSHYLWNELEFDIAKSLANCPPICLYIDAVDEQFETAPIHWLKCQEGLFHQIMRFLRHPKLGGRLHVVICIRDIVLSSLYKSEHACRFIDEPHIRVLSWNKRAINHFLAEKVARLDSKYFALNVKKGKTISNWLGVDQIRNVKRDCIEPIEQYLLRHTRLLPRDIILLGNKLCNEIKNSQNSPSEEFSEDLIRKAVSSAASRFGNEQLKICASQLASMSMPLGATAQKNCMEFFNSTEYTNCIVTDIKEILHENGNDRFSFDEVQEMERSASEKWGEHYNLFSTLWQNGLIGYINGGRRPVFFCEEKEFDLPRGKRSYVLHSCLIDAIDLKSIGNEPVINFE